MVGDGCAVSYYHTNFWQPARELLTGVRETYLPIKRASWLHRLGHALIGTWLGVRCPVCRRRKRAWSREHVRAHIEEAKESLRKGRWPWDRPSFSLGRMTLLGVGPYMNVTGVPDFWIPLSRSRIEDLRAEQDWQQCYARATVAALILADEKTGVISRSLKRAIDDVDQLHSHFPLQTHGFATMAGDPDWTMTLTERGKRVRAELLKRYPDIMTTVLRRLAYREREAI